MVGIKQGDIIKINLDPKRGHEQAGYRPVIVISSNFFNKISKDIAIVCPITNTNKAYPLHVPLDARTKTTGTILCDHIQSIDVVARGFRKVEKVPDDILETVINTVSTIIEK